MKSLLRMMNKNFGGVVVFVITLAVYGFTASRTVDFWDCGEFISCAALLQVPHPPGAPLYLLLARIFSLMSGDSASVAFSINLLSVVASAAAVLFVYLILARILWRLFPLSDSRNHLVLEVSAVLGALLFAFTDTFWSSALEAEVYALSLFFTVVTLWVFLKWFDMPSSPAGNRWCFLGIYLLGLSIGVHLLNLLLVPVFVLLGGWKKRGFSAGGTLGSMMIGLLVLGVLYFGLVRNGLWLAGVLELWLVNDLGLFQHSGVLLFAVVMVGLIIWGIWFSYERWAKIHALLVAAALILFGYSSYLLVPVRAAANTPVNMSGPNDIFSLENYINRKQYGDRPILYGPHAWAQTDGWSHAFRWSYLPAQKKYVQTPSGLLLSYPSADYGWFPRIYSHAPQQGPRYSAWVGRALGKDHPPGLLDEIRFFTRYQLGHMYLRYVFWNFVGRQNGITGYGDALSGNWASGIPVVDNYYLGNRDWPLATERYSASAHYYYGLPFLLVLLGLVVLLRRGRGRKGVLLLLLLLFALMGPAIAFYLNMPPVEPRERDYVFVGSFMVMALLAGVGIYGVLNRVKESRLTLLLVVVLLTLAGPGLLFSVNLADHDRSGRSLARDLAVSQLRCCPPQALLFTYGDNDTYPLWYAQQVEGVRRDVRLVNLGLLNIPWYVNQQRLAVPGSAGLEMLLSNGFYMRHGSSLFPVLAAVGPMDNPLDRFKMLNADTLSDSSSNGVGMAASFPVSVFGHDAIQWHMAGNYLSMGDVAFVDLVSTNAPKRPICFTRSTDTEALLGLQSWLKPNGLVRLLSSEGGNALDEVSVELNYGLFFDSISVSHSSEVWWDHTCRSALEVAGLRGVALSLAKSLLAQGKAPEAAEVLKKSLDEWPFSPFVDFDQAMHLCSLLLEAEEVGEAGSLLQALFDLSVQDLYHYRYSGYLWSDIQKRYCPRLKRIKQLSKKMMMPGFSVRIDQELSSLCRE